jgi:hypothetical protein
MKHRVFALLFGAVLLMAAHPSISYAQNVMFVTVDFEFVAHGKTLPAGTYVLRLSPDMTQFTLTQTDTPAPTPDVSLETKTRLASMAPPPGEAHVVFEKEGDAYILSEIWLPDEDGWLVYPTTGQHMRRTVKGTSKRL